MPGLLKHRLPDKPDHMLAFAYLAYSMMALLHETDPAFQGTWVECLCDLGPYRMAVEDDDIFNRDVWTNVSRQCYSKSLVKALTFEIEQANNQRTSQTISQSPFQPREAVITTTADILSADLNFNNCVSS